MITCLYFIAECVTLGSDQSAVCSVSLYKALSVIPEYESLEGVHVPNCKMQVSV